MLLSLYNILSSLSFFLKKKNRRYVNTSFSALENYILTKQFEFSMIIEIVCLAFVVRLVTTLEVHYAVEFVTGTFVFVDLFQ